MACLIFGIPIYLGVILIHRYKKLTEILALNDSPIKGILFPMLFSLPIFIGFALIFKLNSKIDIDEILIKVIAVTIFEELFFGGFLFGQLFRYTKAGFVQSALFDAFLISFIFIKVKNF